MDVVKIKECLTKGGRQELGIPIILPSFAEHVLELAKWALEGSPIEARQFWFIVGNAEELRNKLHSTIRGRVLPLSPDSFSILFKRGPFDALLLPTHGFTYSDPNMTLSDFWKRRGKYTLIETISPELQLWFWQPFHKPMKLFGLDHHHAVLWDLKQILRPLGIQLDFHWLCDGRPPINEAIPYQIPGFQSSLDIYKKPVDTQLSKETIDFIKEKKYDGIITSHSLITCYRLKDVGLPMIHMNSTRFGNDWITDSEKHETLVKAIQELLTKKRLHIVHNNLGDLHYFHQYFPYVNPDQEVRIPSLCESLLRLRSKSPSQCKILLWDTRQVLLREDGSPFMKELYVKLKQSHREKIDSQAILMAEAQTYLAEGYLDSYSAVVHIPYNISTMSMFQQVRANIPIWVPSKRLLASLLTDSREPNEMSWTVFADGSEVNASELDQVRKPEIVEKWLSWADFYNPDILPLVFQFDSIQELVEKVCNTDYDSAIQKAEEGQMERRENITFAWEQVCKHF